MKHRLVYSASNTASGITVFEQSCHVGVFHAFKYIWLYILQEFLAAFLFYLVPLILKTLKLLSGVPASMQFLYLGIFRACCFLCIQTWEHLDMDVSWAAYSVTISEMYPSVFKDMCNEVVFFTEIDEIQKELVFSSAKASYLFGKKSLLDKYMNTF